VVYNGEAKNLKARAREHDDGHPKTYCLGVDYRDHVNTFVQEFYGFSAAHPEYGLTRYAEILEECGIPWGWGSREMHQADVSGFDKQSVLALIMGAIRADRFAEGALLKFFEDGSMARWLRRLKEIM
jgi:hypothetical protein